MNRLTNLALSVGETLVHEAGRLLFGIALGRAKELLGTPQPLGIRQLALNRALQKKAVDGALLAGPRTGKEYARFTLKKGLPTYQRPRTLAVENQPHSVDDFNGPFLWEDWHGIDPAKEATIRGSQISRETPTAALCLQGVTGTQNA